MKIGILTASRLNNNGTDLQCAAMHHIFRNIYPSIEIVDYRSPFFEKSRRVVKRFSLKSFLFVPYFIFLNASHGLFRKKYIKNSKKKYFDIESVIKDYDELIVGSDQIWNMDITHDLSFYLPGSNLEVKRRSYAVSFGKTDLLPFDEKYHIRDMLNLFEPVSVRESSATLALKRIGVDSIEDLDPILMAGKDFLLSLFKPKKPKKRIVLLYLVENHEGVYDYAKQKAQAIGARVVRITSPTYHIKGITSKWFVGLPKWLNYIYYADLVITDSYHCVSTSIALNKKVYIYDLHNNESNTRTECLLNKLEIEKNDYQIDYEIVDKRIDELRRESFNNIEKWKTEL